MFLLGFLLLLLISFFCKWSSTGRSAIVRLFIGTVVWVIIWFRLLLLYGFFLILVWTFGNLLRTRVYLFFTICGLQDHFVLLIFLLGIFINLLKIEFLLVTISTKLWISWIFDKFSLNCLIVVRMRLREYETALLRPLSRIYLRIAILAFLSTFLLP